MRYSMRNDDIDNKLADIAQLLYEPLVDIQRKLDQQISAVEGSVESGTNESFLVGNFKTVNAQLLGILRILDQL